MFMITYREMQAQYRLHAYVCGPGCVRWSDQHSTVTFEWIYLNRPDECRYAVAGKWSTKKHGEEVLVWDLFDARQTRTRGKITLIPPRPKIRTDELDAAIMASSMLYDSENE